MFGMRRPGGNRTPEEVLLVGPDHVDAHRLLELEDEPGADRLDDRRRAALLPMDRVGEIDVLLGVDVRDRASADHVGHRVLSSSRRTIRTPGVLGPPMNLCGERKTASLYAPGCFVQRG